MAGIDRLYVKTFAEYKEFKQWANKQFISFYDGYTIWLGELVKDIEKQYFNNSISILNSSCPTWLDIYLIQNCNIQSILDLLNDNYDVEDIEFFKRVDLTKQASEDLKKNRKITLQKVSESRQKRKVKNIFLLTSDNSTSFEFHEENKVWAQYQFYPTHTNCSSLKSLKAVVRQLRNQYLPSGLVFDLRDNNRIYIVTVK